MSGAGAPKPRKSRFILTLLLAISLLFNVLALGAGVRLYQARRALLGDGAPVSLPRDLRRDLTKALAAHAPSLPPPCSRSNPPDATLSWPPRTDLMTRTKGKRRWTVCAVRLIS